MEVMVVAVAAHWKTTIMLRRRQTTITIKKGGERERDR